MTEQEIIKKALVEVGDLGENTLYEIRLPFATTSGTFTLTFVNQQTSSIGFNASPEDVLAKLEGLENIGDGNVKVWGAKRGPYLVELIGEMGSTPYPEDLFPLTGNGSSLSPTGSVTVHQIKKGEPPSLASLASESYQNNSSKPNDVLIFLYVKLDLLNVLVGRASRLVDTSENEVDHKLRQRFLNLKQMLDDVQGRIDSMENVDPGLIGQSEFSRMYMGQITKRTPNGAPYGKMVRQHDGTYR